VNGAPPGGEWKHLYRAVDKAGNTIDFLLTAKRDRAAAKRFPARAIEGNGLPQIVTIDKSGANTAGIESYNAEHDTTIAIRQCKYLNNIVEQDHRAVKNASPDRCSVSSLSVALASSLAVSRSCT
jgi:transposase-like protein